MGSRNNHNDRTGPWNGSQVGSLRPRPNLEGGWVPSRDSVRKDRSEESGRKLVRIRNLGKEMSTLGLNTKFIERVSSL